MTTQTLPKLVITEVERRSLLRSETALMLRLIDHKQSFANEKDLMSRNLGFSGDLEFWESAIADTELALKTVRSMFNRASVVEGA